jgi:hypothetical protein
MDSWTQAGSVTFNDGTLSRILKDEYTSNQNDAANLARAAYSAIAAGEKAGLIKVWTARNDDANEPMYEIHLAFKDREVTIGAMTIQGHEIASVQTYFPQILKQAR